MGIAIGLMYIPGLGIISQYFHKRRSLALGIGTSVRRKCPLDFPVPSLK